MKRVAFTIILNGHRHLVHNNYYETMSDNFDLWVIVEGVANPGGSTEWCNKLIDSFHNNFISNDGTSEFLDKNKEDDSEQRKTTEKQLLQEGKNVKDK